MTPLRYRAEKASHAAALGLIGHAIGLPILVSCLVAGIAYWLVSLALVDGPIRWDDKARDLGLGLCAACVVWHPFAGLAAFGVLASLPIRN